MKERLHKIIASSGVCSRRGAEKYIAGGRVTVNGNVASLGDSADREHDVIMVDGKKLPENNGHLYIMLNKPRGVVTTMHDDKGRKTVADFVSAVNARVYPVGRLDYDSEGLLIMTNDGDLANRLMHPSYEKDKVYRVTVTGDVKTGAEKLKGLTEVDGYRIAAAGVKTISCTDDGGVLEITIHEGRNRQVRKMCAQCRLEVKRLVRIAEDGLQLGGLKPGQWRHLTENEIRRIMQR